MNLFWIFDQSGAFDVLQSIDDESRGLIFPNRSQNLLEILQQRLQDVPIDWEASNDVQRADICVTRQWMRAVLWRISLLQHADSNHVTSVSLPIQIAQEFLAVISKLPTAAIESHGPSIVSCISYPSILFGQFNCINSVLFSSFAQWRCLTNIFIPFQQLANSLVLRNLRYSK